jgi:hypothetical protein
MKIPNWLVNFFAKKLGSRLFKEDGMDISTKKWWESKTIWAGIITFLLNAYVLAMPVVALFGVALPPIPEILITIITAIFGTIVIYGRASATKTIS